MNSSVFHQRAEFQEQSIKRLFCWEHTFTIHSLSTHFSLLDIYFSSWAMANHEHESWTNKERHNNTSLHHTASQFTHSQIPTHPAWSCDTQSLKAQILYSTTKELLYNPNETLLQKMTIKSNDTLCIYFTLHHTTPSAQIVIKTFNVEINPKQCRDLGNSVLLNLWYYQTTWQIAVGIDHISSGLNSTTSPTPKTLRVYVLHDSHNTQNFQCRH